MKSDFEHEAVLKLIDERNEVAAHEGGERKKLPAQVKGGPGTKMFHALRSSKLRKSQLKTVRSVAEKEEKALDGRGRAVSRDGQPAPVVGCLKVSNLAAFNLCRSGKRNPYLHLSFEGKRAQTSRKENYSPLVKVVSTLGSLVKKMKDLQKSDVESVDTNTVFLWEEEEFSFPITDVAADLSIDLYASKPVGVVAARSDSFIGKIIVPLSHIIEESSQSLIDRNTVRKCKGSFELFPLPSGKICYTPVIKGFPGTGLVRPNEPIGKIFMEVEVRLEPSVLQCYALSKPYRPLQLETPQKPDPKYVRRGANRLKYIASAPPYAVMLLQKARTWKNAYLSIGALIFLACLCYVFYWWQLPLVAAFLAVTIGYASRGTQERGEPEIYNDEIEPDPELPDTIVKKYKLMTKLLSNMQQKTNKIASGLERVFNSINWTDERVSILVSWFALGAGVGLSFVSLLVDKLIRLVQLNNIVFGIGLIALSPPSFRQKLTLRQSKDRPRFVAQSLVLQSWHNIMERIPDESEVTHRTIAKRQRVHVEIE